MVNEENLETNISTEEDTTDYKALYESEQIKNSDLGNKIYKLKKENKIKPTESINASSEDMETFYNEKKFFETNPGMEEYKDKLSELTSKGNSLEDAKYLLEKNDPTIASRKIANQTNFTAGEPFNADKTSYKKADLETMSQADYNKVMTLREQGKITIN